MPDTQISLPASNRAIRADRFEAGLFARKTGRSVWSRLPLLTFAFVLVLTMCGCSAGIGEPSGAPSLSPGALQVGEVSVSAESLSFGDVTVNGAAREILTLNSIGTLPVTVNSAATSTAAFSIEGASFPVTLDPGRSMNLTVQFQPAVVGASSGQLSISSNSSAGTTTVVALSGTGTAADPELTASAASLSFGSVAVNVATTSNLTLTSTGTTPVIVSSAQIQGAEFTIVGGSFPATLNPGQALSLLIRYQPTAAGAVTGQLTIASNSLNGGFLTVPLTGVATAIAHEVDLSWLPPSSSPDPVVGYNIYRSVGGGGFTQLNSVISLAAAYVDNTVASAVTYGYVVKSVDASGVESTASNEFQITIP
ncbi:choice-of-anchor D domain-containing protein [Edaphobacter paludis]|uniref:Choice-of-anchor D domain-containing protein n=1 Tax=Edaphobacter paludis TaxID=3035702 RepID=A0AAU7D554_9BACT